MDNRELIECLAFAALLGVIVWVYLLIGESISLNSLSHQ